MTSLRRILVVDGDPSSRARIAESLLGPSHEVTPLEDAATALEYARREKPDLVVTEMLLPDMTGIGLCRLLREDAALGHLGILVVTGLASEIDRVLAFEAGVDDFLPKPFFARELTSRALAVLRRSRPGAESMSRIPRALQPAVALQPNAVIIAGRRLELTPREHQLLAALIHESGRVVTRQQLIQLVWGVASEQDERVVDAHIKAIRRKLGEAGVCVETVRGVVYRYAEFVPAA
jgi:two-component system phosphate regulon response regulator PhoB